MDTTNQNALLKGTVLQGTNTYTIERVLGSGGFGITYLASTTATIGNLQGKFSVAIKEHFMGDYCERHPGSTAVEPAPTKKFRELVENSRKDFMSEARRLKQLGTSHSNIVSVSEVFEANGTAYYVMEYLDGQSLDAYIKANGPLDNDSLKSTITPILNAVAYLHRNRFTHLDIKPANIMLTTGADGCVRPVLIDFGLSKHYDESGNATSTVNTCGASDGFAPVEQYQGIATFSPAADVYALGATMLNCATGMRPASSANWNPGEPAATIAALPLEPAIKEAMNVALSNSPHNRYPDAGAMLAVIESTATAIIELTSDTSHVDDDNSKTQVFTRPEPTPKPATTTSKRSSKPLNKRGAIIGALTGASIVIVGLCLVFLLRPSRVDDIPAATVTEINVPPEPKTENIIIPESWWNERRTPHNLALAVKHNGSNYYLSKQDYEGLTSSQKDGLDKIGITVIGSDDYGRQQRFILALNDANLSAIDWADAMARFSDVLPTKAQGEAWAKQHSEINWGVQRFGGNWPITNDNYWTTTEYDTSRVWVILCSDHLNPYKKTDRYRVRTVTPLPAQ